MMFPNDTPHFVTHLLLFTIDTENMNVDDSVMQPEKVDNEPKAGSKGNE